MFLRYGRCNGVVFRAIPSAHDLFIRTEKSAVVTPFVNFDTSPRQLFAGELATLTHQMRLLAV